MTATQDLIAASLTLADMDERVAEMPTQAAADVREMCARAMVQPDNQEQEGAPADWQDAPPGAVGHYPMTKPVVEVPMPEAECDLPPLGWRCTRANGHEGPCAAVGDKA